MNILVDWVTLKVCYNKYVNTASYPLYIQLQLPQTNVSYRKENSLWLV